VGLKPKMTDYSLRAITSGKDAQGEVTVRLEEGGLTILGRGASTDIIEASAKAYLNALNKLMVAKRTHQKMKGAKL
jgi:2-isopropylmalate synthase